MIRIGSKLKLTEALVRSRNIASEAEYKKTYNKIYDEIRHAALLLDNANVRVSDYTPRTFTFEELDRALNDYYGDIRFENRGL